MATFPTPFRPTTPLTGHFVFIADQGVGDLDWNASSKDL